MRLYSKFILICYVQTLIQTEMSYVLYYEYFDKFVFFSDYQNGIDLNAERINYSMSKESNKKV